MPRICKEVQDTLIVAKPCKDLLSLEKDLAHLLNLVIALSHILLIDAKGVYPEPGRAMTFPGEDQEIPKISADPVRGAV